MTEPRWYETCSDKELVDELCEFEEGLTEWEMEFVDSLATWVEDRMLTDRQRDVAEGICARFFGR